MIKATVLARGQITLGGELLEHLGVQPGQKISVEKLADGSLAMRAKHETRAVTDSATDEFKPAIAGDPAGKR